MLLNPSLQLKLRPSRLRLAALAFLGSEVPVLLGTLARLIFDSRRSHRLFSPEQLVSEFGGTLVIALILAFIAGMLDIDQYLIVVEGGMLEGPLPKTPGKRVSFPVSRLNRIDDPDRSFLQKLFGRRTLSSIDGEKILLNGILFSQGQLQQLYQTLNYFPD